MSQRKSQDWKPKALEDSDTYDRTVEHATLAYKNAQEITKFIDTKCNVIIALSIGVAGFVVSLAKWNFELPLICPYRIDQLEAACPILTPIAEILFVASLLMTVYSIACATWSVVSRHARSGGFTVLFPVPRDLDEQAHLRLLGERLGGMKREDILQEFREQLSAVGAILQSKLRYCRMATIGVLIEIGCVALSVIIYAALAVRIR